MDQFLAPLILLDEGALTGLNMMLIVIGGVVASFLCKVSAPYRRVRYLVMVALLGMALTISQLLWALTPVAAEAGVFSLLVIAGLGSMALFGAGLYYVSASRSLHIDGSTGKAWMGFVPFVNFYLVFKGGSDDDTAERRSALARFIFDPLLVTGALTILLLSQGFNKAVEDTPFFNISDSAALATLVAEAQTLEESFANEARLSQAQLPIRLDEMTVMTKVEALGKTLRITYDVEREIPGFRPDFEATLADMQCGPDMFATDIARGGTVEMVYLGPTGRNIQTFYITQEDCGF